MKKFLLVISLTLSCICLSVCSVDGYKIQKNVRFVSEETLELKIAIGYDSSITDISNLVFLTRDAFNEIERQLNIKFESSADNRVTIGSSVFTIERDCSSYFKDTNIKYDVIMCILNSKLVVINGIADGLYFPSNKVVIVSVDDNNHSVINTIMHELGHFLGANHSKTGLMTEMKGLSAYTKYLQFSKTSIKQIKEHLVREKII